MDESQPMDPEEGTTDNGAANASHWPFPDFPALVRYRFMLEAVDDIRLPPYSGSAWRGLLGHGLRRAVCVTRQPRCDGCLLAGTCVYSTLFESPGGKLTSAAGLAVAPHPFVLVPDPAAPRQVAAGAQMSVGLNLLADAIQALPYLIHAMSQAGERGIGGARGRFRVFRVEQEPRLGAGDWEPVFDADTGTLTRLPATPPPAVPAAPSRVRLEFLTPLRVKRNGRLVGAQEFEIRDLLCHLGWRLAALQALYGRGGAPAQLRWQDCTVPEGLLLAKALRWQDWTRYSSRQEAEMQMGGLVGSLTLDGASLGSWWPGLWLGQWTHLGKATSMGLGCYRLADAASLPSACGPARSRNMGLEEPAV